MIDLQTSVTLKALSCDFWDHSLVNKYQSNPDQYPLTPGTLGGRCFGVFVVTSCIFNTTVMSLGHLQPAIFVKSAPAPCFGEGPVKIVCGGGGQHIVQLVRIKKHGKTIVLKHFTLAGCTDA